MKILLGVVFICAVLALASASSHGEAPLSAYFPQTDVTDVYAFRSTDPSRSGFITLISNWNPRQLPQGGPNFYSWDSKFSLNFNIDNLGLGYTNLAFQFIFNHEFSNNGSGVVFNISGFAQPVALKIVAPLTGPTSPGLGFLAYYKVNFLNGNASTVVTNSATGSASFQIPFDNAGNKTIVNYTAYADQFIYPINIPGCSPSGQVFVGQRAEPFVINLGKIFDLVNFVPVDGSVFPGGITQNNSNNVLRITNIGTVAIEVPTTCLTGAGNGVIGVWANAVAYNFSGKNNPAKHAKGYYYRQKTRMANPLVNELFTGLVSKDRWNEEYPYTGERLNHYIFYPTFPTILDILFNAAVNSVLKPVPPISDLAPVNFPRKDLIHVYLRGVQGLNQLLNAKKGPLQDLLRLNTSFPITAYGNQSSLGVLGGDFAGFPNGRRPGEDVIDITLRAAMGALCYVNGLGYCVPAQAPTGNVLYTDGAPNRDINYPNRFPYFNYPVPGSVDLPCSSISC